MGAEVNNMSQVHLVRAVVIASLSLSVSFSYSGLSLQQENRSRHPQVPQMPLGFQLQNHGPPLLVPASLPFILAYCRGSAALSFSTKDPGFPSCNMEELDPVLSECPSSIDVPSLVIQNDSLVQGFQVSWGRQISVYETCKARALNPVTHLKL